MDCGPISGWMGTLNDWFTNAGFADFSVRSGDLYDGDVIRVMYSCDGGPDLGGDYATAEGYLNSLSVSAGDLEPAFAKDTMAYTLTADSGVRTVDVSAAAENKQDRVTVAANGTEYHRGENVPAADGTEITVTCGIPGGEKIKTYTITVAREGGEIAVEKVELDKTALELDAGETETLTAAVTPDNATDKTVVWTSSDDAVATVENGKVTAVAAGEATITATAGGKRASCAVTVKAAQEMVEKTVSIPEQHRLHRQDPVPRFPVCTGRCGGHLSDCQRQRLSQPESGGNL